MSVFDLDKLMTQARQLAADYRRATGKSLPITNEIAKHDACVHLGLAPEDKDVGGYDAIGQAEPWQGKRIQIKGRVVFDDARRNQRIGQLKLDKIWDAVILVILDENFTAEEMFYVDRADVEEAMHQENDKRSGRGAMSINKFRHIAHLVWTRERGRIEDELWDNQLSR